MYCPRKSTSRFIFLLFLALLLISCTSQQEKPFTFVVIGDHRPADENLPPPEVFSKEMKSIEKLKPTFIVDTGDLIFGVSKKKEVIERQYRDLFNVLSQFNIPIYPTVGNHEVANNNLSYYIQNFHRPTYYSFNYHNSHFIVLSTEEKGEDGSIEGRQLAWLKQDLNRAQKATNIFIFMHRPMFPKYTLQAMKYKSFPPERRDELRNLFLRYSVKIVFAGHEHVYSKVLRDGIWYINSSGGGAPLYLPPEQGGFYHYVIVSVKGRSVKDQMVRFN